jgi:hypothetical protein
MADAPKLLCDAAANPKVLGGPRCGKPAIYSTPLGYRCAVCIELFKTAARSPNTLANVMAGRARTEEEIEAMIKALN